MPLNPYKVTNVTFMGIKCLSKIMCCKFYGHQIESIKLLNLDLNNFKFEIIYLLGQLIYSQLCFLNLYNDFYYLANEAKLTLSFEANYWIFCRDTFCILPSSCVSKPNHGYKFVTFWIYNSLHVLFSVQCIKGIRVWKWFYTCVQEKRRKPSTAVVSSRTEDGL